MPTHAIDVEQLVAFDVHVHLEHTGDQTDADKHAAAYFKGGGARDAASLAEYYRSRKMACVIFTVDETLTGTPRLSNDAVIEFAAQNADIALPFASINPTRGAEAVREAKRLVATGAVRGLKLHPPIQEFWPNDRIAYPLYEVFAEARLPVLFHTGHSGIGTGMRGGGGIRLKYGNPMPIDDVAVDFPDMPIVHGASLVPVAGRGDLDLPAQAAGLHRLVRVVTKILLGDAHPVRELAAEAQGAVRIRLPAAHARQMAGGLREDRHQGRSAAAHPQGECRKAVRTPLR